MFKIQTKQQKKKEIYPYMNLYIWATFLCLTIVFLYICFNGGNAFAQWVSHDIWDTGNDFFNSIPAVKGFGLGYKLLGQYPPLAKLFFLLMAHIYSYHGIPLDTAIRNSMTDPRMQQAAMVPFILFILFTVFAVIVILDKMFENEKQSVLLGISVIGTYSVLFAIERGNIILLSFMFLMFFIAFYQSENKWLREAALISLALSAGLKFYPAAFGVLLLYERRWKEAARTVVYGLLALFIPYLIGKQYLPENEASSLVNSVAEFAQGLWNGMFGARTLQQQIFIGIAIVVALMGMVLLGPQIRRGGGHWIATFYAGVLALICGVQFAYPYTYTFLIPSLVLFLKEEKQMNFKNTVYFILLCLINLPLPIFGPATQYSWGVPVVGEIKMWILFIAIILITLTEIFTGKTQRIDNN